MLASKEKYTENKYLVGNNLSILAELKSETIQLIYIDPPYATGRDFGDFCDKFQSPSDFAHNFLKPRLIECHRLLKNTGVIVVHIEPKISHYVRMALDDVFGFKNFRNEIVWKSGGNKKSSKQLARFHDVLIVYVKNQTKSIYNPIYLPYSENYKQTALIDKDGRAFTTSAAHNSQPEVNPRPNLRYKWNGHNKQWYVTKEVMQQRHNTGLLKYSANGIPRFIKYLDKTPGVPIRDLWTDIAQIQNGEKLDYATQKPVKLIERVVELYSNPGDLVLDCFAGSGTTGRACINLKRKYFLIDINPKGHEMFMNSIDNDLKDFL